jgi:hypothetical protein
MRITRRRRIARRKQQIAAIVAWQRQWPTLRKGLARKAVA